MKLAIFTDTLDEMNGVSRFIRDMAQMAHEAGHEIRVITCSADVRFDLPYRVNFKPIYARRMPFYPDLPMVIPPRRKILNWAREWRPDAIEVSTPGAMGMIGMKAACELSIPRLGVYHTDFPAFVNHITRSRLLSTAARAFMCWFYSRLDLVFSRTSAYFPLLEELGIHRERVMLTLPFVDTRKFRPESRDPRLWDELKVSKPHKLLFCGRVSREKNMPMLADIFKLIAQKRNDTALIIAGFGPYLDELKTRLDGLPVHYLGYLSDAELARLYASSDLYIFPSLTDTLGQVILESQACGTPVMVSNVGGPQEVVDNGKTGMVLPGHDPSAWAEAITKLLDEPQQLSRMRMSAARFGRQFDRTRAFSDFWRHFEVLVEAERTQPLAATT